jgi:hypothetical protein
MFIDDLGNAVTEQNALGKGDKPNAGREVVVDVPGTYLDVTLSGVPCEAGDRLVSRATYAGMMVGNGWAHYPTVTMTHSDEPEAVIDLDTFDDILPANTIEFMKALGLDSFERLRDASDDTLLKVDGIGPKRLADLRERLEGDSG